ncbi:ferritin-like domain-containing protein [Sulfitobacter sp. D35]|uniref:ferritin-like domain-containing protein n=1 Tax=Sulfitobacter sp. D35 TaxID=3083252 RepID=UPI00296E97AC|nr:ferritin-like domain-containing protein [Sulfitobacter sp. D35]MDW4497862.1 ferritin-like domain-containing protein [Sulfitobacter sp. D35]
MNGQTDLCDALCHVLGNTCRIGRTTKSYEWNVQGKGALMAEACFREQASELEVAIEHLARHIVGLGGRAILDYSDAVVEVNPPTTSDVPDLATMVRNLKEGHTQAGLSVNAANDLAREADEVASVKLLADRLEAHRGHGRRLFLLAADV